MHERGRRFGSVIAAILLTAACASGDAEVVDSSTVATAEGSAGPTGIAGRVTDADGEPLAEVLVQPVGIDEAPVPVPDMAVVTGNDGRYVWRLRPGAYRVTASRAGFVDGEKRVRVERGRMHDLDFVLDLER